VSRLLLRAGPLGSLRRYGADERPS